jgi:ABC-2 type transport system ATP-binding protein
LNWLADSNEIPRRRVDEVLGVVGLSEAAHRRVGDGHHVKVVTPDAEALGALLADKGATVTVDGPQELSVQGLESRDIGILACGAEITLYELWTQRASLEDAFMELTRDHAEYRGTTKALEVGLQ